MLIVDPGLGKNIVWYVNRVDHRVALHFKGLCTFFVDDRHFHPGKRLD